ncbi:DUF2624 family protein [Sporolactobacillus spathodeae]|uniref:DUF2624 domain-containing protein n=1 Tax=Sporolactobacillus spathodeae TaxID=1465502 RepID=A0ABS2Q7P3_9BACL|nr:DUF2624 family protein [Sporolactobacillus spathodeae]MBM7657320.1 hypothetical protein [Sporolactobacillus spathodeae]
MNPFIQQIVNQRVNQVTAAELYEQAKQLNLPLQLEQAERLAEQVHGKNIDLFHPEGQNEMIAILSSEVGAETAHALFQRFKDIIDKFQ